MNRRIRVSADHHEAGRTPHRGQGPPRRGHRGRPVEILELSHRIHADPEPAYEEHHAAAWVAEALARHGFDVQAPAGSLATAVRAVKAGGRGGPGPRIGILAEYDALPGLGHGCGHNTMAASGVGAAIALASLSDDLPGEIVFLGCPAEERGSGKKAMIEDGLFDGLDAALLYHPCDRSHVYSWPLASEDIEVVFTGLQAHASSDPWRGKNALDAMVLLFSSVGLWRQQLLPECPRPRDHPGGRDGGQHHPGPDPGVVHAPQHRPGLLRDDEGPILEDVRGRRPGDRDHGRGRVLGRGQDDEQQPSPGRPVHAPT